MTVTAPEAPVFTYTVVTPLGQAGAASLEQAKEFARYSASLLGKACTVRKGAPEVEVAPAPASTPRPQCPTPARKGGCGCPTVYSRCRAWVTADFAAGDLSKGHGGWGWPSTPKPEQQVLIPEPSGRRNGKTAKSWDSIPVGGKGKGYYALEHEGTLKFYRVERATKGRWAGVTFVSVQASDEFHSLKGLGKAEILNRLVAEYEEAGLRYATEIGRCTRCNKTLTDQESRDRGMGRDCASKA